MPFVLNFRKRLWDREACNHWSFYNQSSRWQQLIKDSETYSIGIRTQLDSPQRT